MQPRLVVFIVSRPRGRPRFDSLVEPPWVAMRRLPRMSIWSRRRGSARLPRCWADWYRFQDRLYMRAWNARHRAAPHAGRP